MDNPALKNTHDSILPFDTYSRSTPAQNPVPLAVKEQFEIMKWAFVFDILIQNLSVELNESPSMIYGFESDPSPGHDEKPELDVIVIGE
jgi:hypothetical protein